MHRQTLEREERLAAGRSRACRRSRPASSSSRPGEGNRRLFKSLRATRVIEGGQTMNPSTEEIVAAVDATPATEVIVLPNNSNVILSAEQAVGAREQADARRADAVRAGGARGDDRLRPRARRGGERGGDDAGARGRRDRRGHDRVARRRRSTGSRCARAPGSGSPTARPSRAGRASTTVAGAVAERLLDGGREILTLLTGADEPQLEALVERDRRAPPRDRDRDPRRRPAALPAAALGGVTMAIRVLLVEDNEVYRSTLELLLDGRDGIEIVGSVADGGEAAAAARAPRSRRRPDGLPAARASTGPRRPRPCAPRRRDAAVALPDGGGDRRRRARRCSPPAPSACREGPPDRRARRRRSSRRSHSERGASTA